MTVGAPNELFGSINPVYIHRKWMTQIADVEKQLIPRWDPVVFKTKSDNIGS